MGPDRGDRVRRAVTSPPAGGRASQAATSARYRRRAVPTMSGAMARTLGPVTVHDAEALDSLAVDTDRGEVVLGIVVPGPLRGARRLADALVRKTNVYVAWLDSGELARLHPETNGLPRVIEVVHEGRADGAGQALIRQLAEQLRPLGLSIRAVSA